MAVSKEKLYEMIVQLLYSLDMGEGSSDGLVSLVMEELKVSKMMAKEALAKALELWDKRALLDEKIAAKAVSYEVGRIGKVEKAILRFSLGLHLFGGIQKQKIIDESIRLTKKFSTQASSTFVHALLDALMAQEEESAAVCV